MDMTSVCLSVCNVGGLWLHSPTRSENWHAKWYRSDGRCPGYLHTEADPYRNILWYRILLRNMPTSVVKKIHEFCTSPASSGSHVAQSQHLPSFLVVFDRCWDDVDMVVVCGRSSAARRNRMPAVLCVLCTNYWKREDHNQPSRGSVGRSDICSRSARQSVSRSIGRPAGPLGCRRRRLQRLAMGWDRWLTTERSRWWGGEEGEGR